MIPHALTMCVCAYNAEKLLPETLQSLAGQSFRDFTLLIIDDASADRTAAAAKAFLRKEHWPDAAVITLPENGGLAAARRYAETHAETEYLGFIDADDIMLPCAVERMMAVLEADPECLTVSAWCEYMSPEGKKMPGGIFIGPEGREAFQKQAEQEKLLFLPPVNISRTEWIRKAGCRSVEGFPPGKPRYQDMCEDLDLWTRMSDFYRDGKYLTVLPEVLFRYRKTASSLSSDTHAMSMRMRHIRTNLKRRRTGSPELSFMDFTAGLTPWQRFRYAYEDCGQNFYKQAGFHYLKKHYFRFLLHLCCAGIFAPGYCVQKFRKNIFPALTGRNRQ